MKRRIAVFANGWNNLGIAQALKGIQEVTDKQNIDIFLFLSFAAFSHPESRQKGEDSIFYLSDYKNFDGAIVFSNMLNTGNNPDNISKLLVANDVPSVSIGVPLDGLSYVGIDNYKGMFEMVDHLVKEHHIKNPAFFAGTKEHPDSNERLDATRKALSTNGIELKDENIRYTNWEYITSIKYAMELTKRENPPDAFICANDNIAIAVCIGLRDHGFSVPKDFIVTGFDKISFASTFYPSITTVYQDFEKIGYIAAWQLIEKIEGTAKPEKVVVSSSFVKNESCGCMSESEGDSYRKDFCINAYMKEMENIIFQSQETDMINSIFNCSNYPDFKKSLMNYYKYNRTFADKDFYFILDSEAKNSFIDASFKGTKQFSDYMDCLVGIKGKKIFSKEHFSRQDLIPDFDDKAKPSVYTFTPLHYDDYIFGYIVVKDAVDFLIDTTLNHYMIQINGNLEQYRKNCKLDEMNKTLLNISNTDQLTGLNNRFGMEQNGIPLLEKANARKQKCAVVFVDINRMKYINDNFGHLQGDLAIRTVSSALLTEMPKNWIGIRYGGDEFIALGVCNDEKAVQKYIKKLTDNLTKQVSSMQLSYPLTASCGYIITDPESSNTIIDYINQADNLMYIRKQEAHKSESK